MTSQDSAFEITMLRQMDSSILVTKPLHCLATPVEHAHPPNMRKTKTILFAEQIRSSFTKKVGPPQDIGTLSFKTLLKRPFTAIFDDASYFGKPKRYYRIHYHTFGLSHPSKITERKTVTGNVRCDCPKGSENEDLIGIGEPVAFIGGRSFSL
jgi:hypothetical protein